MTTSRTTRCRSASRRLDSGGADFLQPVVLARFIKQRAAINRIRAMPQSATMVASWSEDGSVSVHNVAPLLRALEDTSKVPNEGCGLFLCCVC